MADPGALADAVRSRRAELGETVVALTDDGRVSRSTWMAIEAARRSRVSFSTLTALDEALDWEPGTAFKVWNGDAGRVAAGPIADQASGTEHEVMTPTGTRLTVQMQSSTPDPLAVSIAAQVAELSDHEDLRLVEQLVSRLSRYSPPAVVEVFRDASRDELLKVLEMARRASDEDRPAGR